MKTMFITIFILLQYNLLLCQTSMGKTSQDIINKTVDNKLVFGAVISIQKGSENWTGSAGNLSVESKYFIASTTKLYITSIILKLRAEGKLSLDDKISKYLSSDIIDGLHIFKGNDYSNEITIKQLLSHTSGLPDYFEDKKENGKSLLEELTSGNDQSWSFDDAIRLSKKMKPNFKPGEKGKAYYSDTNFQILGKIIETITGKSLSQVLDELILQPLALKNTYLYSNSKDTLPATIYFKNKTLPIPLAMASFGPDGGIVSNSEESIIFLKAFFGGQLFPKEYLNELYQWNSVMFPLEYGVGIMRFKLPRILSPFKPLPELLGHSGLSGAFAYYCPKKDIYLTGTINQIHKPDISYKLMMKLINSL